MITLTEKVRFLSDAAAYPRATAAVEAKETHMSWVFLGDDRVHKLKKPVIGISVHVKGRSEAVGE